MMAALFAAVLVIGALGTLQVYLDGRARRAPKDVALWLHAATKGNAPVVCDQDGRTLQGIVAMQYLAEIGAVDRLVLEVLVHDGRGYFVAGRAPK